MLIAHAPAGYILSKLVSRNLYNDCKLYTTAGVIGSIACDFDMLYWYTLGNRAVNHHAYWTHIPAYWALGIPTVIGLKLLNKKIGDMSGLFLVNVYLHLALDSYSSGIKWLYPFNNKYYSYIDPNTIRVKGGIPARDTFYTIDLGIYKIELTGWMYNATIHWTFQLELVIVCLSIFIFIVFFLKDRFKI